MKTNFNKRSHLVLATGNDRIISVIGCEAGLQDFTDRLIQSISEDFDANKVVLHADITIIENGAINIFKVTIYSSVGNIEEYFKLINTPIY